MPPGKIRLIFYALISLLFLSCDNNEKKEDNTIPIIRLDPSQEDTLRISDYFNRIDLIRLDWMKRPEDFIEFRDKYLVQAESDYTSKLCSEFHIFDKQGDHLYQIGKVGRGPGEFLALPAFINLSQDSTLRILDYNKYLTYRLNGDLVNETPIETVKYPGFRYLWQDSLIVFFNMEVLGYTPQSV